MSCNCYLFCNKVSSRIVLTSKGFSVFFWITLSHEVSGHFPVHTHTSTYANFKNLLYIRCTLADIPLSPLGDQPRISERKSWKVPIVTEQGNPGIYVQIDEWLPLYKGNIYVVDEVTGRMCLSKGSISCGLQKQLAIVLFRTMN